jgi:hypothetical protein
MIIVTEGKTPKGLNASGRRLWRSIVDDYALDIHEELLLLQACRCVDRLDRLAEEAAGASVTVINARGDQVPHPALTESRQQSITLSRLLASLRLPTGDEAGRPQRRGASRQAYQPRRLGLA